ncbi:MAG: hypothetical protein JO362_14240, partial [Streptomycetaceae bacterium]|nr:hypothetical protein [Streptomycetaceae bacterium]
MSSEETPTLDEGEQPTATPQEEAPFGYWPEECRSCGELIARTKPAGAGRPPEYCSTQCQNDAKAARARERNSPGLPGQIARLGEYVGRMEQITDGVKQELAMVRSPAGLEARLAAARAEAHREISQAQQATAAAQGEAAQARADAEQARTEAEQAEAARAAAIEARDHAVTVRNAAIEAREDAEDSARKAVAARETALEQAAAAVREKE